MLLDHLGRQRLIKLSNFFIRRIPSCNNNRRDMKIIPPLLQSLSSVTSLLAATTTRNGSVVHHPTNHRIFDGCKVTKLVVSAFGSRRWMSQLKMGQEDDNNDSIGTTTSSTTAKSTLLQSTISTAFTESCVDKIQLLVPPLATNHKRIYLVRHGETDWNAKGLLQGGGYDLSLNANGQYQAQSVANILAGLQNNNNKDEVSNFDVVVSSHLQRAEQTADIITNTIQQQHQHNLCHDNNIISNNKPIRRVILEKFGEMRFGSEFEGINIRDTTNDVTRKFHTYLQLMVSSPNLKWPAGGESIQDVEQRGIIGLQQVIRDFPSAQHIIIVAHGRFNKIVLNHLLLSSDKQQQQQQQTQNSEQYNAQQQQQTSPKLIEQDNTCINIFDIDPTNLRNDCKLHVLNFNEHSKNWQ